jgi:hypothetical protein
MQNHSNEMFSQVDTNAHNLLAFILLKNTLFFQDTFSSQ